MTVTVTVTAPGAVPVGGAIVSAWPFGVIKDAADAGTETTPDIMLAGELSSGARLIVVVWPITAVKIVAAGDGLALADADEAEAWEALGASA